MVNRASNTQNFFYFSSSETDNTAIQKSTYTETNKATTVINSVNYEFDILSEMKFCEMEGIMKPRDTYIMHLQKSEEEKIEK